MKTSSLLFLVFVLTKISAQEIDFLHINEMDALFASDGVLFFDNNEIEAHMIFPDPVVGETPVSTIFLAGLWVGGIDDGGLLHVAAQTYRQSGNDFWPGPIATDYDYPGYAEKYDDVWVCNKSTIDDHITNWNTVGYIVPESISDWPGNGDPINGEAAILAPFFDYNNNMLYDPENGDYPIIRGDQAAFFIFNDDAELHMESGGEKLGLEIHAMAYAFDAPSDSALDQSIFLNYAIINKSTNNYSDFIIGMFSDFDIGAYDDDFVGCDTVLNMFYGYNGDGVDGPTSPNYGPICPAQGIMFLNQPLYTFKYFINNFEVNGNPETADDYYEYISGLWKDGSSQTYGGNGYGGILNTRFVYPGDVYIPDSWSENTGVYGPFDRRGIGSVSPQTLGVGDTICLDMALPAAIAYDTLYLDSLGVGRHPWYSISKLKERATNILDFYNTTYSDCSIIYLRNPDFVEGVEQEQLLAAKIYPNPANTVINIEMRNQIPGVKLIEIWNAFGQKVLTTELFDTDVVQINVNEFPVGLYFIQINSPVGETFTAGFQKF
jgi:hypothetical protein